RSSGNRTRLRGGHPMSSRFRRLLVLTAVLALSLGASGAVAPAGLAANPTNTKVAGIDVDATTIPQLEALMNSHRINAIELTNFYLRRINQFNPLLHAVITVSPTARADAVGADHARRSGDHRPLAGIPIARNVTAAAALLGAATGVDSNDTATGAQAGHAFSDYTQFLNDDALQGARIGVWRAGTFDPSLVGSVVDPILANAKSALEAQG